jgi:hypothetical protein
MFRVVDGRLCALTYWTHTRGSRYCRRINKRETTAFRRSRSKLASVKLFLSQNYASPMPESNFSTSSCIGVTILAWTNNNTPPRLTIFEHPSIFIANSLLLPRPLCWWPRLLVLVLATEEREESRYALRERTDSWQGASQPCELRVCGFSDADFWLNQSHISMCIWIEAVI